MPSTLSKHEWLEMDRVVVRAVKMSMRKWASFYIDRLPRYYDVQAALSGVPRPTPITVIGSLTGWEAILESRKGAPCPTLKPLPKST